MISKQRILYIIIIVLVTVLLLREGCYQSSRNDLLQNITEYKTEAKHYKLKNGTEVAQNKALMLENQTQIKALLNKNDTLSQLITKYKNLQNVTIINNSTEIKNDSIAYDTIKIPCDFKPFQVVRDSSHYMFVGTIAQTYFKIDSLRIPDKQSIIFGERKMGFLKKRQWTVEVVHSNPLVKTTNIGEYAVKQKRKKFVIALGGGYGLPLSDPSLQPYVGAFIGLPIISW